MRASVQSFFRGVSRATHDDMRRRKVEAERNPVCRDELGQKRNLAILRAPGA